MYLPTYLTYLGNETIEVGVGRSLNVEVAAADIIEGLVVQAEGDIGVLEQGMGGQDRVVRLHHGRGDLRSRRDGERELGLAAVIDRETLEQEGTQTGASAATSGVEDQEALLCRGTEGRLV